jgi:Cytochrome P450
MEQYISRSGYHGFSTRNIFLCHPEAQKKAQAELDKVLNGRLPEHSDITSLRYLWAFIKEVYRYAANFVSSH